jgi:anti-sigma B factor antagonist
MRYEIKTPEDNIAVFSLTGRMLGDKFTSNLYDEAKSLIGKGIKNIIIDLRQIEYINSIGLGVIIACRTSTIKVGGTLKLIGINDNIKKYFTITSLDSYFDFYKSEDEALASFSKK